MTKKASKKCFLNSQTLICCVWQLIWFLYGSTVRLSGWYVPPGNRCAAFVIVVHFVHPVFLLFRTMAPPVPPRNLTLGAKSEFTTGKLVDQLDSETRGHLKQLLTMNNSNTA